MGSDCNPSASSRTTSTVGQVLRCRPDCDLGIGLIIAGRGSYVLVLDLGQAGSVGLGCLTRKNGGPASAVPRKGGHASIVGQQRGRSGDDGHPWICPHEELARDGADPHTACVERPRDIAHRAAQERLSTDETMVEKAGAANKVVAFRRGRR